MGVALTLTQTHILEALARYRYLTAPQMLTLGISRNLNSLNQHNLQPLRRRSRPKLIQWHNFGAPLGYGQLPYVYALADAGARMVAEVQQRDLADVRVPQSGWDWIKTFQHRMATVDFHIQLNRWADRVGAASQVTLFDFDKRRLKGHKSPVEETLISWKKGASETSIKPDGLFCLQLGGQDLLYALEIHITPHTQRITDQLLRHLEALEREMIAEKYHAGSNHFVLTVHHRETTLKAARAALQQQGPKFARHADAYLFNTLEQIRTDFNQGWTYADGSAAQPFPLPQA